MFRWARSKFSLEPRLPYTEGDSSRKPRHDPQCHSEFSIDFIFSHMISHIYINISESGNGNSQYGKPQAYMLGFVHLMYFSCGGFDVKWTEKHLHIVKFNNIYFSFFLCHLLQLVLWSVLHHFHALSPQFLLLKTSVLQSHVCPHNVHMHPEFLISDWIANLCALTYSNVKTCGEVVGLNCSGYTFKSTDERYSTQKNLSFLSMHSRWVDMLLAFNSSMISVCNIIVAHPPHNFKWIWYLTLAALGT